jgi:NMD protein affecting ribosome stability and mRNA decay
MRNIDELFDGSDAHLLGKCGVCGEEIFEKSSGFCEDCRVERVDSARIAELSARFN